MKIGILEDEAQQSKLLTEYLVRFKQEHTDFFYSLDVYDRAWKLLEQYRCDTDLLLLDIRVPDMLGMEAARRIRAIDQNVMIVFVTNLTQYAIEGYAVNAFDYVLKPLVYDAFCAKMARVLRVLSYRAAGVSVELKSREGGRRVLASAITYIEIANHDILVHTGTETIRQWGTLSKFEEQLRDAHFVRCNTCYLVNLKYVRGVKGDKVLVGEDALAISKPRRKEFLCALAQYKGGSL